MHPGLCDLLEGIKRFDARPIEIAVVAGHDGQAVAARRCRDVAVCQGHAHPVGR